MKVFNVNCYPSCSEPKIVSAIQKLLPCIDITRLRSSFFLNGNGNEKDEFQQLINAARNIQNSQGKGSGIVDGNEYNDESGNATFMHNVFGFFSLMTEEADAICPNIPVFSSPQISINNSAGWNHEQSLLQFVKTNITGKGLGKNILKGLGIDDVIDNTIDEIERFAGLAGWSARVSPYFSLANNPFSDRPRLNIEIKLINDTIDNAINNAKFLDVFIRGALIGTKTARETGGIGNSFFSSWMPPCVFNVGLKYGITNNPPKDYVKRYFFCTLEASVTPEGIMRSLPKGNERVPDAYDVKLNFNSLMPDTIDTWRGGFLKHMGGQDDFI